jgi:transcription elongation factor Elf1
MPKKQKSKLSNLSLKQQIEYLNSPNECPFCHSTDIQAGHFDVESPSGFQSVSCNDCGHSWEDQYNFVGMSDVAVSDENGNEVTLDVPPSIKMSMEVATKKQGWNTDSQLELALRFISEHSDGVMWMSFLQEQQSKENGEA